MLCRPGIKDETDDYESLFTEKEGLEDIWDTPYLRDFPDTVDPDSVYDPERPSNSAGRFFTKRMGEADSGRYAFTFSADSFNPSGNLTAKMSVSATGMYMVLLNLPPHLRHKTENIYFAGIIPGPGKPSNDQMNHFVQLVVNELGPLYAREGITFSRTAKYPNGRTCRGILVVLVADALAARQLGGFASVTSYYPCTLCKITKNDLENIQGPWVARDSRGHYGDAMAWKDVKSIKDRGELEKKNLVRWSPFLLLPYWSPIFSTAIDSMHNLYLGLIKDHCRVVWGINTSLPGGDGKLMPKSIHPRPPHQIMSQWIQQILDATDEGSLRELLCKRTVPVAVLWYICYDNGLRRDGDQYKLARRIANWVGVSLPVYRQKLTKILQYFTATPRPSVTPEKEVQVVECSTAPPKIPNLEDLPKAREALKKGKADGMMKFRLDVLRALCDEQRISYIGKSSKSALVKKLVCSLSYIAVRRCR